MDDILFDRTEFSQKSKFIFIFISQCCYRIQNSQSVGETYSITALYILQKILDLVRIWTRFIGVDGEMLTAWPPLRPLYNLVLVFASI